MARTVGKNPSWPDIFRCFVVLCALMYLLAGQGAAGNPASDSDYVYSVYRTCTVWAFPALFLLWGLVALEDSRSGDLPGMALSYLLPVFVTIVVWSALYALLATLLGGGTPSLAGFVSELRQAAAGDTLPHLQLLYPLMGLCLVLPVLRRFAAAAGRWEVLYFLLLSFLFACVLPVWSALRPGVIPDLLTRMEVRLVLGYAGCFVGGWYLARYTLSRVSEFLVYILGIAGLVLTLAGPRLLGGSAALWQDPLSPGVVLTAAALAVLFRYVLGISDERSRRQGARALGGVAFGIYLFHHIWVLLFRWLGFSVAGAPALPGVPLFALLFFVLSIPFAWLLCRIPGVGRFLTAGGS